MDEPVAIKSRRAKMPRAGSESASSISLCGTRFEMVGTGLMTAWSPHDLNDHVHELRQAFIGVIMMNC